MTRLMTVLIIPLLILAALAADAQTFLYPSAYACGNGTIRARIISASTAAIAVDIQKTDSTCQPNLAFVRDNRAYVRLGTAAGTLLGSADYHINDTHVT